MKSYAQLQKTNGGPPFKSPKHVWVIRNSGKGELMTQHLTSVFQQNNIFSIVEVIHMYKTDTYTQLTPMEVALQNLLG